MVIIDEALTKLDGKPAAADGKHFSQQKNASGPMSDLAFVAGPRKRKPVSFLLAIALAGTGVAVYLLLPGEAPQPPRIAQIKTPAPSVAPLPASAQKIVTEPVSSVESVSAVVSVSAVAPASAGSIKQAVQPMQPVQEVQPAAANIAAKTEQTSPPPAWYEAGWKAARAEKWADALALWEDGMRGLPRDRMAIVSNSYASMDQFLSAIDQHAKLFQVVGMRQRVDGKTLYRVIVFPYGGGAREMLPKVRNLFSHAWLVNASHLQQRLDGNALQVAAKPAPKPAHNEMLGASQKQLTDQKTVAEQKLPAAQNAPAQQPAEQKPLENPGARLAAETVAAPGAGDWETRSSAVRDQLKAEDYAGAGKGAQTLARDFPERWEGWFWLGTAQLAQGQMDAAGIALERASKLNPKMAQIWVQRAIVAQERGDHGIAVKLLNEARELAPKSPQIYLNLGFSNDALGLTAEADKNYIRFLSLTEGNGTYALQRKPIMDRLENKH